jgi:sugar lactone lactonase YvrE
MRKMMFLFVVIVLVLGGMLALAQDDALPDSIVIEHSDLYPEGVEYDAEGGRFLVGSMSEGTIFAVNDDGALMPFIEDEDLKSTTGIHIDIERNRLLVVNQRFAPSQSGYLGIYDLTTGDHIAMVDLTELLPGAYTSVNDVTVDADGNVYVTDSATGAIYLVDLDGNASLFSQDEQLAHEIAGANGIEYHPDGYLLVSTGFNWSIIKVPLDDPETMTLVEMDESFFADGLILHPDGTLIAVGWDFFELDPNWYTSLMEAVYTTYQLQSDDDWQSATIIGRVEHARLGTTAAIRDGAVYTVLSDVMLSDIETFEIIRIDFETEEE